MKKNFKNFVVALIMVLCCVFSTGCGVDDAASTVSSAKETVVNTASDAKQTVDWWTRSTDHMKWKNPSGTEIEITERRKEGDFKIEVKYAKDTINTNPYGEERYTDDATIVMYVDSIDEELMEQMQAW